MKDQKAYGQTVEGTKQDQNSKEKPAKTNSKKGLEEETLMGNTKKQAAQKNSPSGNPGQGFEKGKPIGNANKETSEKNLSTKTAQNPKQSPEDGQSTGDPKKEAPERITSAKIVVGTPRPSLETDSISETAANNAQNVTERLKENPPVKKARGRPRKNSPTKAAARTKDRFEVNLTSKAAGNTTNNVSFLCCCSFHFENPPSLTSCLSIRILPVL
jgi:hypothetical protein